MARHGVEHPVGTDSDMVVWEQYVIHGWPTSVLVDARGYAVAWFRGEPELGTLTAWIEAALDDGRSRGVLAEGPPEFQRPAVRDTGPLGAGHPDLAGPAPRGCAGRIEGPGARGAPAGGVY